MELCQNTSTIASIDFLLDISYGVMFTVTLFGLWQNWTYNVIRITFYIPLIILLCLTLIDRKGLASSIENNAFIALIIICLTMKSKDAIRFSVFLIIGTLISLTIVELQYNFLEGFVGYSTASFNFLFMASGSVMVTYYGKHVFEKRKTDLYHIKMELSENHHLLKQTNARLESKTIELERLNINLENKVKDRLILLNDKRKAMKEYLDLTSQELEKEYYQLRELTIQSEYSENDKMSSMMIKSGERLDEEINELILKLKEEQ